MSTAAVDQIPHLLAEFIDSLEGDYITYEVAEDFLAAMREREPAELDAWLHQQALTLVEITIGNARRSKRARAKRSARARAFDAAAEAGDVSFFTQPFVIDDD